MKAQNFSKPFCILTATQMKCEVISGYANQLKLTMLFSMNAHIPTTTTTRTSTATRPNNL
jgi:hypothetical protein